MADDISSLRRILQAARTIAVVGLWAGASPARVTGFRSRRYARKLAFANRC